MPPANSRKRPAPGASPAVQTQPMSQNFTSAPTQLANDSYLKWNPAAQINNYPDPSGYPTNIFGTETMPQTPYQQPVSAPSTQLARRPGNRHMVTTAQRQPYDEAGDPWGPFGENSQLEVQAPNAMEENDTIELLEEKAVVAKREAQSKRKQIPPFVQKLSSFLDESKNTELIRWSDRGDSFVVLDEDEFAKTLIPELFKHNNYASFVRQLNMYGFHKRVGLSDNSMKASERKNKSPSEYYNPYFKRGHPNLLWLINKPKGGAGGKKGKAGRTKTEDGAEQSDEEAEGAEEVYGHAYGQNSIQGATRAISAAPESGQLQRREIAVVRDQLKEIQTTQNNMSTAIARLRKDHNQLFQQAMAFQTLHERHESSITAILTFLATVYNRGLDGQGNVPNFSQMFANGMSQEQQRRQGDVVDIGDYNNQEEQAQAPASPQRRQQRLLMAPPLSRKQSGVTGSASTSPSPLPQFSQMAPGTGSIEELFEGSPSDTSNVKCEAEPQTPQQDIMNLINNTNANRTDQGKGMEFPAVLSHYENANGNSPLTTEQRSDILKRIANSSSNGAGIGMNNALVTPMPLPPQSLLEHYEYSQEEIDNLARMQEEQAKKLNEVSALLQPLSPGGLLPGLNDSLNGNSDEQYFGDASTNANLDLDQFLMDDCYAAGDDSGFNYGGDSFDGTGDMGMNFNFDVPVQGTDDLGYAEAGGRIQETNGSSSATSPGDDRETTPSKRRRVA